MTVIQNHRLVQVYDGLTSRDHFRGTDRQIEYPVDYYDRIHDIEHPVFISIRDVERDGSAIGQRPAILPQQLRHEHDHVPDIDAAIRVHITANADLDHPVCTHAANRITECITDE